MKRVVAALLVLGTLTLGFREAHAQSTVNPAVPAQNAPLNSAPVRSNFNATYTDINGILNMHAVSTLGSCLNQPLVGTDCLVEGSPTLYSWYKYVGTNGYALVATTNPSAGTPVFTFTPSSGSVVGTSPITANYSGGVTTVAFNFSVANTFLAQQLNQGATTTNPGWYAQITGDTTPRARFGLDSSDVPSIAFGPGNAARDAFILRGAPANIRLGSNDSAAPVAQTLSVQNVLAGTSNTVGSNFTIDGSIGTGSGVGGSIIFQIAPVGSSGTANNSLVQALAINGNGGVTLNGAASNGLGSISTTSSANINLKYVVTTTSTGTNATAGYWAYNTGASGYGLFGVGSTGYTAIPLFQNSAFLDAGSNTAGIVINNEGATNPIIFALSSVEIGRWSGATAGLLQLGVAGALQGSLLLNGVTSGGTTLTASATASGILTVPSATDTLVGRQTTDTLLNKTIVSSSDVLGPVTMTLGSDANGDIYCRSGGVLTRVGAGSAGFLLQSGGAGVCPTWVNAPGGGNVTNSGTPVANQLAQWTNATTIQGITLVTAALGGTGVASPAARTIPINEGSSAQNNTGTGITGQALTSGGGGSVDPAWQSGVWTLLATLPANNTSGVLQDTTHITTTYNDYRLVFEGLLPATNNITCAIQLATGSASFQTTGYLTSAPSFGTSSAFFQPTTFIPCSGSANTGNVAPGLSGEIVFPGLALGSFPPAGSGLMNNGGNVVEMVSGAWNSTTAVTGFRVSTSAGNWVSGSIKLYGRL